MWCTVWSSPSSPLWPEEQARLVGYGVRLDNDGAEILVRYEPKDKQPLDEAVQTILLRGLREWLDAPEIELSSYPDGSGGGGEGQVNRDTSYCPYVSWPLSGCLRCLYSQAERAWAIRVADR